MTTAERIKEIRKELKLTQKEVADCLGINAVNISQIENGTRGNISFETLYKLTKVFGEKSGKEFKFSDIIGDDIYLSDEYWSLYGMYEKDIQGDYKDFYNFKCSREESNLLKAFSKLNILGQRLAVERVNELGEIKKYRKSESETETSGADHDEDQGDVQP